MQQAFVWLVGHSLDRPTLCMFGCLICLGGITSFMLRWVQVPSPPSLGRNRGIQEHKYHERKDWKKIEVDSRSTHSLRSRWNFADSVATPDIENMSLAARRLNTRPWTHSISACWWWGSQHYPQHSSTLSWNTARCPSVCFLNTCPWTYSIAACWWWGSLQYSRHSKHASMKHDELPFCVFLKHYLLHKSPRHYSKKHMRLNRINCSWNHRNKQLWTRRRWMLGITPPLVAN